VAEALRLPLATLDGRLSRAKGVACQVLDATLNIAAHRMIVFQGESTIGASIESVVHAETVGGHSPDEIRGLLPETPCRAVGSESHAEAVT